MLSSNHYALSLQTKTPRINNISVERHPSCIEPWWFDYKECMELVMHQWVPQSQDSITGLLDLITDVKSTCRLG